MTRKQTPCMICESVRICLDSWTISEIVEVAVRIRKPPEVIDRHLLEHRRLDLRDRLCHNGRPLPDPDTPRPAGLVDVFCPDCGALLATDVGRRDLARTSVSLHAQHTCPQRTHTEEKPVQPVEQRPRPPAADLASHPDKRIARQAAKVLAEQARLTELWEADQGKAALRAKRDRLKAQLAKVEAELRGGGKPALPSREIRAWAASQGIDCPATGKLPAAVVQAWEQATAGDAA